MPRLAASFWLVGASLAALAWSNGWWQVPWRACRVPLAALALFIVVSAAATAAGVDPIGGLLGTFARYQGLLPLLMYALLLLAALAVARHEDGLQLVFGGVWLGGVISALYALIQKAGWDWVQWSGIPEGRIGGAFGQPDVLGIELLVAAAVSVPLLYSTVPRARIVIGTGIALMLVGVLVTLSRAAWVGAGAAALVLIVFQGRDVLASSMRARVVAAAALLILASAVIVLPAGRRELSRVVSRGQSAGNFGETGVSQRVGLWYTALDMARDRPLLGAGPDAFPRSSLLTGRSTSRASGQRTGAGKQPQHFPRRAGGWRRDRAHRVRRADRRVRVVRRAPHVGARRMAASGCRRDARRPGRVLRRDGVLLLTRDDGMDPWLLLGGIVGVTALPEGDEEEAQPASAEDSWKWEAARWGISLAGLAVVIFGALLFIGDFLAGQAGRVVRHGDILAAADDARAASRWDPLNARYLLALGQYEDAAGNRDRVNRELYFGKALDAYHTMNTRFEPTPISLVREASAAANLHFTTPEERQHVFDLVERAAAKDPYNLDLRKGIADFYVQAKEPDRAAPHQAAVDAMAPK